MTALTSGAAGFDCLSRFIVVLLQTLLQDQIAEVGDISSSDSFLSRSEWLDHAMGASTGFMVASGGGLSEGNGHDGPGVCLGDGQTEAYLKDMGMTGLASAWAMARRRLI